MVETILYSVGVVLIIGAIVGLLVNMYRWYDQVTISSRIDQTGTTMVDRVLRDIRTGVTINTSESIFNFNLGSISVNAKENGLNSTRTYSVSGGRLVYKLDAGQALPVSSSGMTVTRFYLKRLDTPISTGVRVELELTFMSQGTSTSRVYSGLAIMRNSY